MNLIHSNLFRIFFFLVSHASKSSTLQSRKKNDVIRLKLDIYANVIGWEEKIETKVI